MHDRSLARATAPAIESHAVTHRERPGMLEPKAFARTDESPDDRFYVEPRFVEHIDDVAIADVLKLYRQRLPVGGEILDLMSSWVSHLPDDITYARVAGLGMNAQELAGNPRLTDFVVHDLNADATLPYADASFDAATICVSIQYLTNPIAVLREVARVVRPAGSAIVTFSNRCFPTKAVAVWQGLDDDGHAALVAKYFASAGWQRTERIASPARHADPLYAVIATSPVH
jgi:SAM-dependent methyltransferase